ncbi:MAG: hypothetical protein ABW007_09255 [Chitinophagaceae bacterium]
MKNTLRKTRLLLWIRGSFFILGRIPFLLVLLFFGLFAFQVNDQGMDMMMAFGSMDLFHPYVLAFIVLLMIWSGVIWYVSRIALTISNLGRIVERRVRLTDSLEDPNCGKECELRKDHIVVTVDSAYEHTTGVLAKVMPRILGAVPYVIFIWSYISVNGFNDGRVIKVLFVLLLGIIHITYLCYRTDLLVKSKRIIQPTDARFAMPEKTNVKTVVKMQHLHSTTKFFIPVAFIGSFVYAWITASTTPSLNGKPGLVILCGLIFYTIISLFVMYISNWLRFPFFTFVLVLALLFFLPRNNNHALAKVNDQHQEEQIDARLPDSTYFENWLAFKQEKGLLFQKDSVTPIFLIAAEGGGIRACYWTAQVLKKLHIAHPEMYENTFAVTGASGGTVGLSFFYNYIFEKSKAGPLALNDPAFYAPLDTITSADFLTGVTYGFMFPDLFQRVLPWPIESWDRAAFLNRSFSKVFAAHTRVNDAGSTLLDQSILTPWLKDANPFHRPAILFNSLYVEEGQKAVFSPYRITKEYYEDALDILDATKMLVPMKEGMVSSARFPVITPPGLMMKQVNGHEEKFGHLVDGGYFENTAVQTAQQTVMMIKSVVKRLKPAGKIVPVIISLSYGSDTSGHRDAMGAGYEAAPLAGGINTLFRWIDGVKAMSVKLDPDLNSINFRLTKFKGDRIPLGWYLSEPARKLIEKYADVNHFKFQKPYKALKPFLK